MEELSGNSNNNEVGKGFGGQHPSPVLSLESSFTNITCNSPDSRNSYSVNGKMTASIFVYFLLTYVTRHSDNSAIEMVL